MNTARGAFERLDAQIGHIESWSQLEGLLVQTPSFATRSIAPSGQASALITATTLSAVANQERITWEDARTPQGNAHATESPRLSSEDTYVIAERSVPNNPAPSRYATKNIVSDVTRRILGKRAVPVDKTCDPREAADDVTKGWAESTTVRPYASCLAHFGGSPFSCVPHGSPSIRSLCDPKKIALSLHKLYYLELMLSIVLHRPMINRAAPPESARAGHGTYRFSRT